MRFVEMTTRKSISQFFYHRYLHQRKPFLNSLQADMLTNPPGKVHNKPDFTLTGSQLEIDECV